jgi:integrase
MLLLRGTTYYYRRAVDKRLRPLLGGCSQIWKSLRTSDLDTAKLRSLEEGQRVERMLQELRRSANSAQTNPESLARLYSSRAEADDAAWRRTRITSDTDEHLDVELDALTSAIENHTDALRRQDVGLVDQLLDEVLVEHGVTIPSTSRREFALALLTARLRSLEVGVRRTKEEQRGRPVEDQGVSVDGLLDAYLTERKLPPKSEQEFRAAYRRFGAIVGGDKPAREVFKADCRAYKSSLMAAPSNRSLSKDGKLSPASVKKLLGIGATIFRYGVGQGYLDVNPFDGITRVVRGDTDGVDRRLPYSSTDLSTERRLKNEGSRGRIPVHPELLRLGLAEYAQSMPADGRLFPELKPGPHGKLSGAFSKWFARFVDERGVKDPRKAPLHSLRHLFKDRCRAAGLSEELHDALTRHSGGSVGRRYGLGPNLTVLADALGRVELPEFRAVH